LQSPGFPREFSNFRAVLLTSIFALFGAQFARAEESTTRPMRAVIYRHITRANPPMQLHIVTVDLADPAVHIKFARGGSDPNLAKPWEATLMPVSAMAARDGLNIAVNGNFFSPKDFQMILGRRVGYYPGNWARACGWSMTDGVAYSNQPMLADWPSLAVDSRGHVIIGKIAKYPADVRQIVSGSRMILINGQITVPPDPDPDPDGKPAPHTTAGIDRDAKILILLVVDGRRPQYSAGLTIHQLAAEMQRLGAWQALNLDSGGSSTLVMTDSEGIPRVINRPSDGHDLPVDLSIERSVVNALGVVIDGATTRPVTTNPTTRSVLRSSNREFLLIPLPMYSWGEGKGEGQFRATEMVRTRSAPHRDPSRRAGIPREIGTNAIPLHNHHSALSGAQ
jgi:exopolysaccharide biosynthesis protein